MEEHDRVSVIFQDRTLFITGGTGFLGKLLIEKLLRCYNVKKVYLLVRIKKGKSPRERMHDVFDNVLFNNLKSQNPTAFSKFQIVSGDITEDDLGISTNDRLLLQNEVDFIIHTAASTRFDDSVKTAVKFNTKSTKTLLDLAGNCRKLKAFMHVSTAYAFPKEKILYEKAYQPQDDPHKVLDMVKCGKDEDIEKFLGDYPNTYSYSKALAEDLVVERMNKIPAIIVRPSVVCPTYREPIKGWFNNLQGPMGMFVGAGKGIIRTMYMRDDYDANFVPADLVINGILITIWNFLTNSTEDRIINLTASEDQTYTWEQIIEIGKKLIYNETPFNGVVWYPGGSIKRSRLLHNICFYLFQLIPAIFIDALLMVLGYKPILYQIQRRIQKGAEVFEYYTNRQWIFSHEKQKTIRDRLNQRERDLYTIDGEGIDPTAYLRECLLGARRHNLKEMDDTIPRAQMHMKIMRAVDIVTKTLLMVAIVYYIYQKVLKRFF